MTSGQKFINRQRSMEECVTGLPVRHHSPRQTVITAWRLRKHRCAVTTKCHQIRSMTTSMTSYRRRMKIQRQIPRRVSTMVCRNQPEILSSKRLRFMRRFAQILQPPQPIPASPLISIDTNTVHGDHSSGTVNFFVHRLESRYLTFHCIFKLRLSTSF